MSSEYIQVGFHQMGHPIQNHLHREQCNSTQASGTDIFLQPDWVGTATDQQNASTKKIS